MSVVIYGATGWTGAKVALALDRRGFALTLVGRSLDKLQALSRRLKQNAPTAIASSDNPRALDRAFSGAQVVVNCAGPYVDTGIAVLDRVLAAGAHYMDVSGEESHVADVYAHDAAAQSRGVTVCPAFAGKGALGDLAAEVVASPALRARGVDDVAIAYAHGLREAMRPSMASILAIAGQGVFRASGFGGALAKKSFGFPPPFGRGLALHVPATEAISVPRHLPTRSVHGFIALAPGHRVNVPWANACVAAMPLIPYVSRAMFSDWGRWHLALYMQSPQTAEDEDSFAASIEVRAGNVTERMSILAHDAYGVTADLIGFGVTELTKPSPRPGVLAPAELCDPFTALNTLQRSGVIRMFRPTPAEPEPNRGSSAG